MLRQGHLSNPQLWARGWLTVSVGVVRMGFSSVVRLRPRGGSAPGGGQWSFRGASWPRAPRGMIYPILLVSILIIGIATAGVAQLWSTQVKREKEAELLFRLGEFRRAIARYRADHNRLPKELKDLLDDRTQLQARRYLRRIYTDPMTGKTDWNLDLLMDRDGTVAGIRDVRSRSEGKPLKVLAGNKESYKDW